MKKFLLIAICIIFLSACSNDNNGLISYVDAKEKIINESAILIDVRSEEEYNEAHIEGAVLLPVDTIDEESIKAITDDKEVPIIVYCRSGNRSSQALEQLKELGYEEVYDLGSMSNWQE